MTKQASRSGAPVGGGDEGLRVGAGATPGVFAIQGRVRKWSF